LTNEEVKVVRMRALLVVNPRATATTANGLEVLTRALSSAVDLTILPTKSRGHATELAARAAHDGLDAVFVHGGDGTVNEVVNGLKQVPTAIGPVLGIIPGGSANVCARALGLSKDPIEATGQLLLAIKDNSVRHIGLGHARTSDLSRWFTFNAGYGWDAAVVGEVDNRRAKKASPMLYASISLKQYFAEVRDPKHITACLPNGEIIPNLKFIFITNTDPWTYGGSIPVRLTPESSFDTGLDFYAMNTLNAIPVLRHLRYGMRGEATIASKTVFRRADLGKLVVSSDSPVPLQVDGDFIGPCTQVELTAHAIALGVYVPSVLVPKS
jgi:diacylglycerol kinase family enzyme